MNGDVFRLGGSLGRKVESGAGGRRRESPSSDDVHLLSACMSYQIHSQRLAREDLPAASVQEELKERLRILEMIARAPAASLEALTAKIEVAEEALGNGDYAGPSRSLLLSCFRDCDRLLDPGMEWEDGVGCEEPSLASACASVVEALGRIMREIETILQDDVIEEAGHEILSQCWMRLEETLREVAGLKAVTAAGVLAKQRVLIACLHFDGAAAAFPALLSSLFQDIDALAAKRRWAESSSGSSGRRHSAI